MVLEILKVIEIIGLLVKICLCHWYGGLEYWDKER